MTTNVLVCVKRVPDSSSEVVLTDDAQAVDGRYAGFTTSAHEECAVELAAQITAADGGEATVLTLGDEDAVGGLERLIRRAAQALGLLTGELGVAVAPRLDQVVLEKLELALVSSDKVLLVLTLRNGVVRTVYVDLPATVPAEALASVTLILNERLAGLALSEIRA